MFQALVLPGIILGLAGGAWYRQSQRKALTARVADENASNDDKALIAKRRYIYKDAIDSSLSPEKYMELAASYREIGWNAEATMLEKRAALAAAPKELKAQRKAALKKGLESTDYKLVRELADAFDTIGATKAAEKLRAHADAVEKNSVPGDSKPETQAEP